MGGGREKAGWLELPAESVRGGGLLPSRPFCILRGPTVGIVGVSGLSYRKKSSSSGRPCFLPSMAGYATMCCYNCSPWIAGDDKRKWFLLARGVCRSTLRREPWAQCRGLLLLVG